MTVRMKQGGSMKLICYSASSSKEVPYFIQPVSQIGVVLIASRYYFISILDCNFSMARY